MNASPGSPRSRSSTSNSRTLADSIERRGLDRRPFGDAYHFLLTTTWTRLFALVIGGYFVANVIFATMYWLDPGGIENARAGSFHDAFFFSVQTMATIGYGKMAPASTFANVVVTIEALFGLLALAMGTGLMFAKFSRPSARVLFSRNVVVSVRDGVPTLVVRLANERATGLVEATLRLILLRDEKTAEGEHMRRFHELRLQRAQTASFFLSWTAIHVIDEDSPLHGATAETLDAATCEIVASLVGVEEASSQTVHARHTWTAREVLFGKKFVDVILVSEDGKKRVLDYTKFHDVVDATHIAT